MPIGKSGGGKGGVLGKGGPVDKALSPGWKTQTRGMELFENNTKSATAAVEELGKALGGAKDTANELSAVDLAGISTQMSKLRKTTEDLRDSEKEASEEMNGFQEAFESASRVGSATLAGLKQGFRNFGAMLTSVGGFLSSVVDGIASIGMSIMSIPFKLFNGFVDMANKAGVGGTELAQAMEGLRKQFGKLSGPSPTAIVDTAKNMKGFAATGLGVNKVFGNLAERIKAVQGLATGMGATFLHFTKEMHESGGAILGYQKGLGLTDEEMRTIGQTAITTGKTLKQVLEPMRAQAQALGDQFGIDSKLISKDMVKAMGDLKHFGGATNKEIATASVYARKLGVELDKITGTLDAFETFDTAAENASKLSQAFGVNVDAFKMMEAQSPDQQVDLLRKQFRAAGVDSSNFNRQQLQLIKSATGLDEATAKQVFSLKNQGMSLDEIKKKAAGNEKKQLSQAEAMSKLADNIERLVQAMQSGSGGFFDRFLKGITGGIQGSAPFIKILNSINKGLNMAELAGVKLGRAIANWAPLTGVLDSIADFFDPKKFGGFFNDITAIFEDFFKTGGDFGDVMEKISEKMFSFFDMEAEGGKKVGSKFGDFFKKIADMAIQGMDWLIKKIVKQAGEFDFSVTIDKMFGPGVGDKLKELFKKGVVLLAEGIRYMSSKLKDLLLILLRNVKEWLAPKKVQQEISGGKKDFLSEALQPLFDSLKDMWKELSPIIGELVENLGKLLFKFLSSPEFLNVVGPAIPYAFGILFGPAIGSFILSTLAEMFGPVIIEALLSLIGGPVTLAIGAAIAAIFAGVEIGEAMDKFGDKFKKEFGKTEGEIGAAGAGLAKALTFGLLPDSMAEQFGHKIAELSKKAFEFIEKWFGGDLVKKIKEYFTGGINLAVSVGDFVKALIEFDPQKIKKALRNMVISFIDTLEASINMIWGGIFDLIDKGMDYLIAAVQSIFDPESAKGGPFGGVDWGGIAFDVLEAIGAMVVRIVLGVGRLIMGLGSKIFSIISKFYALIKSPFVAMAKSEDPVTAGIGEFIANIIGMFERFFKWVSEKFKEAEEWINKGKEALGLEVKREPTTPKPEEAAGAAKPSAAPTPATPSPATNALSATLPPTAPTPAAAAAAGAATEQPITMAGLEQKAGRKLSGKEKNVLAGYGVDAGQLKDVQEAATNIKDTQKKVNDVIDSIDKDAFKKMVSKLDEINKSSDIEHLQYAFKDFGKNIGIVAGVINMTGIMPALDAIEKTVEQVNKINQMLSKLPTIKLDPAKLKAVGAGLFKGGSKLDINPPNINIKVEMSVEMNAADMEKALVLREKSIIRGRLNFATNDGVGKEATESLPASPSVGYNNPPVAK